MRLLIACILSFITVFQLFASDEHEVRAVPRANTWDKSELSVCYKIERASLVSIPQQSEHYIQLIEQIISKEYTRDRTGISFVGWNECDFRREYDVKLTLNIQNTTFDSQINGDASIGVDRSLDQHFVNITIFYNVNTQWQHAMNLNDYLQLVTLQEFGHVTGLYHPDERFEEDEHIMLKSNYSIFYQIYSNSFYHDVTRMFNELGSSEFTWLSLLKRGLAQNYDKNSVMSKRTRNHLLRQGLEFRQQSDLRYVNEDQNNSRINGTDGAQDRVRMNIALSEGDVNALKCLYVYRPRERREHCKNVITYRPSRWTVIE